MALPLLPALFFQRCFPCCLQLCLGCCQLVLFSCRYVEIPAILCLPSPLFLSPQALARPFLAQWFEAPIIVSYVFSSFSSQNESLDWVAQQPYMFGMSHTRFLAKNELLAASLGNWPTYYVYLHPCCWLRAPVISDGKLLVSRKRRLVEVEDILLWTEAYTIYQRWFVLLIPIARLTCPNSIADHPTAHHSPGHLWLDSGLAFLPLSGQRWIWTSTVYLRLPALPSSLPLSSGSPLPMSTTRETVPRALWRSLFSPLLQLMQWKPARDLWPFPLPCPPFPHHGRVAPKWDRCLQCFLYIAYTMFLLLLASLVDCLAQWLSFVPVLLICLTHLFLHILFFSFSSSPSSFSITLAPVPSGVVRLPWSCSNIAYSWPSACSDGFS